LVWLKKVEIERMLKMRNLDLGMHLGYFRKTADRIEYNFEGPDHDEWLDAYKQSPDEESFGAGGELLFLAWMAIRAYFVNEKS
jgi:hypothetical protein